MAAVRARGVNTTAGMRDMVATMRSTSSAKTARTLLTNARNRLGDVEFIGWPLLEASMRDELAMLEAVARERGLLR